jgi:predicted metal-binding membrane protein
VGVIAARRESGSNTGRSLNPYWIAAILVTAALSTWIVTVQRMKGMDAGPGTDLGGLAWFLGIWVTMMAAMMLPSAMPMLLIFAKVSRGRYEQGRAGHVPVWIFLVGYFAAWTGYGLVAYGIYRGIVAAGADWLAWDRSGPYVAGGAVAAAGLYELTPLKEVCLRHCRGPMHFILSGWRKGKTGALHMGLEHGAYCVGCCWGLMVILFALGVMSLFWMALIATVIFAEKVLPFGFQLSRVFTVAFVALGTWIAVSPGSVPGLTDPDRAPSMMQMDKMEP